jgi:L-rhamnose mutarotase
MRIALHSITREDHETGYDQAHAAIPDDLVESFARVGIHDWTIWRSGRHLFHVVDCDDFTAAMDELATDPANLRWQATIGPYVERFELLGEGPAGMIVPQVWRLTDQSHRHGSPRE